MHQQKLLFSNILKQNIELPQAHPFTEDSEGCEQTFRMVAKSFSEVLKFNPYHDRLGRFTSANGGFASFSANPNTKAGKLAIERASQNSPLVGVAYGTTKYPQKEEPKKEPPKKKNSFKEYIERTKQKDRDFFYGEGNVKDVSNKYFTFKRVIDDDNCIVVTNNVKHIKGNPVLVVGNNQAVYLKDWQLRAVHNYFNGIDAYAVKLNRKYFKPYTFRFSFDDFHFDKDNTFDDMMNTAKEQQKENMKFAEGHTGFAKSFYDIFKFNPYHDARGRFTTAGTAASFTYRPGASVAHDRAIERERERVKQADKVVAGTDKMASYVIENQFISSEKKQCIKDLQNCYQSIAMKNGIRWDAEKNKVIAKRSAVNEMKDTARKIMEKQEYEDTATSQDYYELHRTIKRTPIKISDYDKQNIPDWNDYRKRAFGNLTISNNGLSIDSFYQELSSQFPHLFDSHRETSPSDQLEKLNEVLTSLKPRTYTLKGRELEEAADDLALQMLNGYVAVIKP